MKFEAVDDGYILRLERGEEIVETLAGFASAKEIPSGAVSGIGAVDRIRCGYFDPAGGGYVDKTFEGNLEILSLSGNLSWAEGFPLPHVHIVFSDEEMRARGGHLIEGRVSVTCEIRLRTFGRHLERKHDPETGLKLLDFLP